MQEMTIHSLTCRDTEDTFGSDECRLEVFADGRRVTTLRRNLNDGQSWTLNRRIRFSSNAFIKLFDEDHPDRDDFLGQVDVKTNSGRHSGRFQRDGADYGLSYSVRRLTPQPRPRIPSRVTVELLDVICHDTEDMTGADEFYVIGAVRVGDRSGATATKPMRINDGERRGFMPTERVLYDGPVGPNDELVVGLTAFDQDAAVDWEKHGPAIERGVQKLADVVKKIPEPKVQITAEIIKHAVPLFGALVKLDVDDELDRKAITLPVRSLPIGRVHRNWQVQGRLFSGFLDFSDWHYNVTLRITAR